MAEGRGNDHSRAVLDHLLDGGGCAGFIIHIFGFNDLNAIDVRFDRSDTLVHGLVIPGIIDGAAIGCADRQAGAFLCGCCFRFGSRRFGRLALQQELPRGRQLLWVRRLLKQGL